MAETWPDAETRRLVAERASVDGTAASLHGKAHSRFAGILFTRDLDGIGPYLDPLEPMPRDHLEKAAQMTGVDPAEIDATLKSLSAHLGWDILVGSRPNGQ